jgi:sarcosine oxidase subunit gamma
MADLAIQHSTVEGIALARLRVPMAEAEIAAQRLSLPRALGSFEFDGRLALWLGPDQWLLVSESESAAQLIESCTQALSGVLHLLVDASAALSCVRFSGAKSRQLLAMGSGLDWFGDVLSPGHATRTRLARIPAIVHIADADRIDVYIDRSHREYFGRWLERSMSDPLLRVS